MKISQLLNKEQKWIKGTLARDGNGKQINCLDILYLDQGRRTLDLGRKAVAWSLYGAIATCYVYDDHENVLDKIRQVMRGLGTNMHIAAFNDHESTTFEIIKKIIQEAGV